MSELTPFEVMRNRRLRMRVAALEAEAERWRRTGCKNEGIERSLAEERAMLAAALEASPERRKEP